MRSSTRRPTGLSASAVTTAVLSPKQRRSPRATLYSPPPSQTRNSRAVCTRMSPGSSRSITSPSATQSQRQDSRLFTANSAIVTSSKPGGYNNRVEQVEQVDQVDRVEAGHGRSGWSPADSTECAALLRPDRPAKSRKDPIDL